MSEQRWIKLDGAVNVRDLGGLPTQTGGTTRSGQVLRGDNLQDLSPADVQLLVGGLGLRHVIDLRSMAELNLEGPGPLASVPEVEIHHFSLFAERGHHTDFVDGDAVLPWQAREEEAGPNGDYAIGAYLGYVEDRPDSIVSALHVMAHGEGPAFVHCAAGKDRTGVVIAFALEAVGVHREAVVDDYVRTGDRLDQLLARLRASPTYAEDVDSRPAESHRPRPASMDKFLTAVDERFGGVVRWLEQRGWTGSDTAALRTRLVA